MNSTPPNEDHNTDKQVNKQIVEKDETEYFIADPFDKGEEKPKEKEEVGKKEPAAILLTAIPPAMIRLDLLDEDLKVVNQLLMNVAHAKDIRENLTTLIDFFEPENSEEENDGAENDKVSKVEGEQTIKK